ncbi:GNAT family N-acetyltransferase [Pararhizobium mangrovi]|uniref:Acyltransferase n=1 Tax=Pararhizobium mangrovi TaxID=2590452 RepID=A0A506TWU5_9HYPH|nr:1-acyl-sn-glycerol-3-phosphate acyltransferase [Pararhizobium mangrovi]TPW26512.1 acyltransferase [Pararhizobium mangrovi]
MPLKRFNLPNFGNVADTIALVSHGQPGHIVDQLIAERGQGLTSHPLWPAMRPFLYSTLHYRQAIRFADAVSTLSGFQALDHLSGLLDLDIVVNGEERIPQSGGFVMALNHPTGIADGIAVFDLLKERRPDMMFFANRDAIRVNPRFAEIVIPVEWREEHKSKLKARETLQLTNSAVKAGKATILFPSGRIAHWHEGKLTERPWKTSAISMARKYNLPIVPVNMRSRNSGLFYWLSKWSTELRDMTVFHELLNKKNKTFEFRIGKPISVEELEGETMDVTAALEHHTVVSLADDLDATYRKP